MAARQGWADATNMSILHAFVSTPSGYPPVGDRPGKVFATCLVYLTSACLQRALLRMGAMSQKLTKPVTEKPATSRLFNFSTAHAMFRIDIRAMSPRAMKPGPTDECANKAGVT